MTLDRKTRWLVGFQISGLITKCPTFREIQTIQTGWWFQIFFIFTPILWGNDPIWRLHIFQMGGKKPPTSKALVDFGWISLEKIFGAFFGLQVVFRKGTKNSIGWSRLLPQQAWIFFDSWMGYDMGRIWVDINLTPPEIITRLFFAV